eukprot:GHVU01224141.1.p1 GENE.GHVU01224141.1~~GHVU01224141.1.p1  ORF type:complete len:114 (-),score=26.09 GHVU01224141.1:4-345(-)
METVKSRVEVANAVQPLLADSAAAAAANRAQLLEALACRCMCETIAEHVTMQLSSHVSSTWNYVAVISKLYQANQTFADVFTGCMAAMCSFVIPTFDRPMKEVKERAKMCMCM